MRGLRFAYSRSYVMARRARRKPKEIPPFDVILLRIRGLGKGMKMDMYLRPDEAVAIAAALMSAVWDELANVRGTK